MAVVALVRQRSFRGKVLCWSDVQLDLDLNLHLYRFRNHKRDVQLGSFDLDLDIINEMVQIGDYESHDRKQRISSNRSPIITDFDLGQHDSESH